MVPRQKAIVTVSYIKQWLLAMGLVMLVACEAEHTGKPLDFDDTVADSMLAVDKPGQRKSTDIIYFGFDLRSSPQEDARQYLPFLDYLKNQTGYNFSLRFTPKNSTIIDELGSGRVDFAAIGADSFIRAREKYQVVGLVRGINNEGRAEYRSKIVVQPDSNIRDLADLKGKRFAFGSETSTQGHLIPRIIMQQHDLSLEDFSDYTYTGSHQDCVNAVVAGKYDACGMQDTMAVNMARQGLVRILFSSDYYPSSGIAAYQGVSMDIIERVKQALLQFDPQGRHNKGLYHWDQTEMPKGFTEARDADYQELREWMLHFDLLKPGKG